MAKSVRLNGLKDGKTKCTFKWQKCTFKWQVCTTKCAYKRVSLNVRVRKWQDKGVRLNGTAKVMV